MHLLVSKAVLLEGHAAELSCMNVLVDLGCFNVCVASCLLSIVITAWCMQPLRQSSLVTRIGCMPCCRNGTWCVCWSPVNEYQLFSGDGCGAVRLWDIRRSGCRALLDFNNTERPKPTAAASTTAAVTALTAAGGRKRPRSGNQQQQQQLQQGQGSMRLAGEDFEAAAVAARPGTALAHEGAVTGVLATQDGLNLVTAGGDQRVRLWDAGESWMGQHWQLAPAACAAPQACMAVLATLIALDLHPSRSGCNYVSCLERQLVL